MSQADTTAGMNRRSRNDPENHPTSVRDGSTTNCLVEKPLTVAADVTSAATGRGRL